MQPARSQPPGFTAGVKARAGSRALQQHVSAFRQLRSGRRFGHGLGISGKCCEGFGAAARTRWQQAVCSEGSGHLQGYTAAKQARLKLCSYLKLYQAPKPLRVKRESLLEVRLMFFLSAFLDYSEKGNVKSFTEDYGIARKECNGGP